MTEKEFRYRKWKEGEVFYTVGFRMFRGYIPIPYKIIRVKVVLHPETSKLVMFENCNKKYYSNSIFRHDWINPHKKDKIYLCLSSYKHGFSPNEYLYATKREALDKLESDRLEFIKKGVQEVVDVSNYVINEAKKTIRDCRSIFRMKIFQQAKE